MKPNRLHKMEALLALRKNWTIEDYEEAYNDEWRRRWRLYQFDLLHSNYDEELIDECLDNEVYTSACLTSND